MGIYEISRNRQTRLQSPSDDSYRAVGDIANMFGGEARPLTPQDRVIVFGGLGGYLHADHVRGTSSVTVDTITPQAIPLEWLAMRAYDERARLARTGKLTGFLAVESFAGAVTQRREEQLRDAYPATFAGVLVSATRTGPERRGARPVGMAPGRTHIQVNRLGVSMVELVVDAVGVIGRLDEVEPDAVIKELGWGSSTEQFTDVWGEAMGCETPIEAARACLALSAQALQ